MDFAARRAVLLDPHPLWLDALERVLTGIGVAVIGRTTEASAALDLIAAEQPELLIAELVDSNGASSSLDVLAEARQRQPDLKIVVLSVASDPERINAAFARGALAYVVKTAQPQDVASAVRQAFEHSIFFPRTGQATAPSAAEPRPEAPGGLTRRELEILRLVAEGHTNAQMARMLWVTEQTVKFHLSNVYRKLDVTNRTEASRWAQLNHLLSAEAQPAEQ